MFNTTKLTISLVLIVISFYQPSSALPREVVMEMISAGNSSAFKIIDKKNKNNITKQLVMSNGRYLEYADSSLKKDKELVLAAIEHGGSLKFADDSLKKDKGVVLTVIKQNCSHLEFVDDALKKDKGIVLTAVKMKGSCLKYADASLKKDKDVVLAAIENSGIALEYADVSLKKDKEIVLAAFSKETDAFQYADESLRKDKAFVMTAINTLPDESWGYVVISDVIDSSLLEDETIVMALIKKKVINLEQLSKKFRENKEIVESVLEYDHYNSESFKLIQSLLKTDKSVLISALKYNAGALKYAKKSVRGDKAFLLKICLETDRIDLGYVEKSLLNDKEFVLAAVKKYGNNLYYASDRLKNDKEVVLATINNNSDRTLEYASDRLKDNKAIVLAAVKHKGEALEFASKRLKDDKEVVLLAIQNASFGTGLEYASKRLQNNKKMLQLVASKTDSPSCYSNNISKDTDKATLLKIIKKPYSFSVDCFGLANQSLLKDREIVLAALKENSQAIQYADPIFKKDPKIMLSIIEPRFENDLFETNSILQFADPELTNNREFILAAVKKNGDAIEYADKRFLSDKEIFLAAVNTFPYAFSIADKTLKNDQELVLATLKKNGFMLEYVDKSLSNNKDLVVVAISQAGMALEFASDALRNDKAIALQAIEQDCRSFEYVSPSLKKDKEVVLAAVSCFGDLLKYADKSLKKDLEVAQAAVKSSPYAYIHADKSIRQHKSIALDKSIAGNFVFPNEKSKPVSTGWKRFDNNFELEKIVIKTRMPKNYYDSVLTFSPDGSLFTVRYSDSDKEPTQVNIWNTENGRLHRVVKSLKLPPDGVLSITNNNKYLFSVTNSDGVDFIWNFADKRDPVVCTTGSFAYERNTEFNSFFVTYTDAPMHLWDMDTCSLITGIRDTARNHEGLNFYPVIEGNKAMLINYAPLSLRRKSALLFFDSNTSVSPTDPTNIKTRGKVKLWELPTINEKFLDHSYTVSKTAEKEFLFLGEKKNKQGEFQIHISNWDYMNKKLLWKMTLNDLALTEISYDVNQTKRKLFILDTKSLRVISLKTGKLLKRIILTKDAVMKYTQNVKELSKQIKLDTGEIGKPKKGGAQHMLNTLEGIRGRQPKMLITTKVVKSENFDMFVSFEKEKQKMTFWKIRAY